MAEEGETVVDTAEPASSPVPFASVEFEIFGLVQGNVENILIKSLLNCNKKMFCVN